MHLYLSSHRPGNETAKLVEIVRGSKKAVVIANALVEARLESNSISLP